VKSRSRGLWACHMNAVRTPERAGIQPMNFIHSCTSLKRFEPWSNSPAVVSYQASTSSCRRLSWMTDPTLVGFADSHTAATAASYTHTHTYTCTCTYTYIYIYINIEYTNIYMYANIYICTNMYTCVHMAALVGFFFFARQRASAASYVCLRIAAVWAALPTQPDRLCSSGHCGMPRGESEMNRSVVALVQ